MKRIAPLPVLALLCLTAFASPIRVLAATDSSGIKLPAAFKQAKAGLWEGVTDSSSQGGPSAGDLQAMKERGDRDTSCTFKELSRTSNALTVSADCGKVKPESDD